MSQRRYQNENYKIFRNEYNTTNTFQDLYVANSVPQRKFKALNVYIRKQKWLKIN